MKEQRSISVSLFCIELLTWAGVNGNDIREREGNEKKTFPKFRNGKGMKKAIPKIRERVGNEKNTFPQFGNGIQRLSFRRIPGNGNGNEKKHNMTIKEKYLANMWREKEFWPKHSQPHPPPFLIIPRLLVVDGNGNSRSPLLASRICTPENSIPSSNTPFPYNIHAWRVAKV